MKPRRDQRLIALFITIGSVGILGGLLALWPAPQPVPATSSAPVSVADGRDAPNQHAREARAAEVEARFAQAITMLHARQFDYAVKALHRVLELSPRLVEAHVNMGYALLGLNDYKGAHDFFQSATALRPEQVNAYYGMAVALEGLGDMEGALGAMRTFVHLTTADDPFLPKARAALWEWQEGRAAEPTAAAAGATTTPGGEGAPQ
ncbi:MAG: tetratricopeptide repeat protein [Gammaproteobacteria bacterium]|nr:tetratricopeptide repeat protein [Gammaproteobacteria bacterium]